MQIYKPNVDLIHQEAADIKQREENRGGGGNTELDWYDWLIGDNYFRWGPPNDPSGNIAFVRFRWENLPGCGEGKYVDIERTYPDKDIQCEIASAFRYLREQYPELEEELKIWPRVKAFTSIFDRNSGEDKARICGFPISVHNWFKVEMSKLLRQGFDPTDIEKGVDFKVEKKKTGDNYWDISYENLRFLGTETPDGFIPNPSPINKDPAVQQKMIDSMYHMNKIFKYPSDDKIAETHAAAQNVIKHFENLAAKKAEEGRQSSSPPPTPPTDLPKSTPESHQPPQEVKPTEPNPQDPPPKPPETPQTPPTVNNATSGTPPQAKPTDKPECYGKHQPNTSDCMMCADEFSCQDSSK